MRELSDKEKRIIEILVENKRLNQLNKLRVADLLKEELESFALKWTKDPEDTITIYSPKEKSTEKDKNDGNQTSEKYSNIMNLLYFIEELENNNFIRVQTISANKEVEKDKYLYDESIYELKPSTIDKPDEKEKVLFIKDNKGGRKRLFLIEFRQDIRLDSVDLLDKYVDRKIIYPLPHLIDYAKDFKTIEQRRFEKQLDDAERMHKQDMIEAKKSLLVSRWSFRLSFVGLIVATITPICCDTQIDEAQIKEIKEAIYNSKTDMGNPIKATSSDTLKIINYSNQKVE